ncbi:hypothetical protein [Actinospica robiniae]|uniref:hypothetical protein n=1 Tax=Actinospica robiniae TaxID=304901 RepID=UPI00041FF037|nr:hypothetical protein [Actinospica robiniae]
MPHTEADVRGAAATLLALAGEAPETPSSPVRHRVTRLLTDLAPKACTDVGLTACDDNVIPALALAIDALVQSANVRPLELAHHLDTLAPVELDDLLYRARALLTR